MMKKNLRGGAGQGPKKTGGKTKSRKNVKNARSLSDVIGGKKVTALGRPGPAPSKSSASTPVETQPSRGNGRGPKRKSESVSQRNKKRRERSFESRSSQKPSKGAQQSAPPPQSAPRSHKLTYITSFQPPVPSDMRPEPTIDTPRRYSSTTADASAPGPEHSLAELHTKADFRWPKERLAKQAEARPLREGRSRQGVPRIQGVVKRHPDGFGFLIPDESSHPDVYISRQFMTGVMTNDRVEAEVYQSRKEDRYYGEIVRVLSRATKRIVGRYLPVDTKYGVILDDRGWGADLRISAPDSMDAREGDLVAVEIVQYPGPDQEFLGRVVGLLGDANDPINDVKRVIYSQSIPETFSLKALEDARKFGGFVTEDEMRGREDLRDKSLITIDGATAKDFDDAVYVEQTAKGFHLIVAIADVSHYVKPGTQLDHEAYEKGTSTYFPNYVVPMLPEELSNELCSLKPHVPRLCFACDMRLNFEGDIESYRFFEGVMESKARVTYGEAQEVIDGHGPSKLKHVEDVILRAADLAKILMNKRFREGSLDLEIPETQVVVDQSGETVDIIKASRLFAHRLIEELMLVTNICTARFMDNHEIPGIFRVHEEPNEDNIRALQRYLWNLGGSRSVMGANLQRKLTKALQSMEGKAGSQVLHMLTLRAMNQAQYSHENIGHFGLGFTHYSHFTSPIRRYPDLIAHRLIKSHLYSRYRSMRMTEDELASASTFLSACEQRSVKAERQVISIKKARFMSQFVGQEFEGLISSVAKFGVFVLLRQYDVDGLVKIEDLGHDKFIFDADNLRLIGQRTGLRYSIGDSVRVVVRNSDPIQGRIDLELAEVQPERDDRADGIDDGAEGHRSDRRKTKSGEKSRGTRKVGKATKKDGIDVQKRSKAENDRGNVRKKRVSRRRRKD